VVQWRVSPAVHKPEAQARRVSGTLANNTSSNFRSAKVRPDSPVLGRRPPIVAFRSAKVRPDFHPCPAVPPPAFAPSCSLRLSVISTFPRPGSRHPRLGVQDPAAGPQTFGSCFAPLRLCVCPFWLRFPQTSHVVKCQFVFDLRPNPGHENNLCISSHLIRIGFVRRILRSPRHCQVVAAEARLVAAIGRRRRSCAPRNSSPPPPALRHREQASE
jgi:hypothetical protein